MIDESKRTESTRFGADWPFFAGIFVFLGALAVVFGIWEEYTKKGKVTKVSHFIHRLKYVRYTMCTN